MSTGGAAGNKGYLFQQYVSAAFLLIELLGRPMSLLLGDRFDFRAQKFLFEGDAIIDDFQVSHTDGQLYANIKTNLRFSTLNGSALRSAFDQFVRQDRERVCSDYLLICDDKSSSQIRLLGEILDRLRPIEYADLSSCLLDVEHKRVYGLIVNLLKELGISSDEEAFLLLRKISVFQFSFEFNLTLVNALKVLAVSSGFQAADLLWSKVSLDCFHFAKARQVIDATFLQRKYEKFKSADQDSVDSEMFSDIAWDDTAIDWVKELLLIEWDDSLDAGLELIADGGAEERRFGLMEIYRFDEEGRNRLVFDEGTVTLLNGLKLRLIARMAAYSSLERLMELGVVDLSEGQVTMMPANVDWKELKESKWGKAQAAKARLAFEGRKNPDRCFECGRPLFSANLQIVEVDEVGREYSCGAVHTECLTPSHRVVAGLQVPAAIKSKWLERFDINRWIRSIQSGPSGYPPTGAFKHLQITIFWNWTNVAKAKGEFCAKLIGCDEDGLIEHQYITERGQVVLRNEADQLAAVAEMKASIELSRKANDPWMFEMSGAFSQKSQFSKMNREVGPVFEVMDIAVERFSTWKFEPSARKRQWYAPICVLRTASGRLFSHQEAIILIRDPFDFGALASQFRLAGLRSKLDGIWLDIIETDHEFDAFIGACFPLGFRVIIDPTVGSDGNFDGGIEVEPMPIDEKGMKRLVEV